MALHCVRTALAKANQKTRKPSKTPLQGVSRSFKLIYLLALLRC